MKPILKDNIGISEKVADYIKEQILKGEYKENERIPSEREMGNALEVSRNTIREAYKILEAYGYLKTEHGKGVYIASEREQIKKMTKAFFLSNNQIIDLFAVRYVLEKSNVEWAIKNSTEKNVTELQQIVQNAEKIIIEEKDSIELAEYDSKFHLYIADMTKNEVVKRIMYHLIDLLAQSRTQSMKIPNRAKKSVEEHAQILNAIKEKDIPLAKKLMEKHLSSVEREILNRQS